MFQMKISVKVTTTRTVEDVTIHEVTVPFYGVNPNTGAFIAVVPVMFAHLPDHVEKLRVVELKIKKGGVLVKETEISAYPALSVNLVALLAAYTKRRTEVHYRDALTTATKLASQLAKL